MNSVMINSVMIRAENQNHGPRIMSEGVSRFQMKFSIPYKRCIVQKESQP